jgi:rubrerythrin
MILSHLRGKRMDILESARAVEKKGEQLYRDMAAQSPIQEIRSIFGFLAGEENLHYELLLAMSRQTMLPPIGKSSILNDSKAAFKNLWEQFTRPGTIAIDREYALGAALELENKSVSLYEKAMAESLLSLDNDPSFQVLKQLVEQEKSHVRLIESLMDFQRHPHEWLENAEWRHLDEY